VIHSITAVTRSTYKGLKIAPSITLSNKINKRSWAQRIITAFLIASVNQTI
jgi:hypothetical protein